MDAVITALTAGITSATLFGALASVAPLLITGVVVGFSFSVLRKVVTGLGKGKARI